MGVPPVNVNALLYPRGKSPKDLTILVSYHKRDGLIVFIILYDLTFIPEEFL